MSERGEIINEKIDKITDGCMFYHVLQCHSAGTGF